MATKHCGKEIDCIYGYKSHIIPMSLSVFFHYNLPSITNLTALGGFFIDLTIVMSCGFNVFNALSAAFNAGIASCKSLSQSSLIAAS